MKLAFITAIGGIAALIASPSLAQPADAPPPSGTAASSLLADSPTTERMGGFRGGGRERMEEMRAALKLRPDQDAAFRTYANALRPDPAMRDKMRGEREKMAALTPDQRRSDRQADPTYEAMRAQRQEAARTFMASLTPEQQQAFAAFRREHRPAGGFGGAPPAVDGAPPPPR